MQYSITYSLLCATVYPKEDISLYVIKGEHKQNIKIQQSKALPLGTTLHAVQHKKYSLPRSGGKTGKMKSLIIEKALMKTLQ